MIAIALLVVMLVVYNIGTYIGYCQGADWMDKYKSQIIEDLRDSIEKAYHEIDKLKGEKNQ